MRNCLRGRGYPVAGDAVRIAIEEPVKTMVAEEVTP